MAEAAAKDMPTVYPGQITLLRPSERTFTRYDRWDLGWGQIAAGGVDVYEIPGGHRSLLRANVSEVGRRLRDCLQRAQQQQLAENLKAS